MKNFKQEALKVVDDIFSCIQKSQNDRIISSLMDLKEQIIQGLLELDTQEEDLKVKEVYLSKLQKLFQFAGQPGNLKQVWKYVSFKIYSQQDQFMELVKNLPILIQYHLKQKTLTLSTFIGQSCAELFSHQLVTFQVRLLLDEKQQKENVEKEDCVGCITYVSPEVSSEKLFRIVMKLKGFTNKIRKLDQMIITSNLDADLLKFTFDNRSKKITLWSSYDQISYQITTQLTQDEIPQFEQKIYLQQGMIIQLTQNFHLDINACLDGDRKKGDCNQNFTPIQIGEVQTLIKPILQCDNQKWISINNGFEDVIYYPNETPLKISNYQTLPSGIEVLLYNDGFGHYITVVGNCSEYYPRIKSRRSKDQLLQLITTQDNFNFGIIYQDNIRLQLSSDLLSVWNGQEMFDL